MTILRFHTPLIEPDRRISRIWLSDKACERNPVSSEIRCQFIILSEIRKRNPVSVAYAALRHPE